MTTVTYLLLPFIFGAIVGSFLNVVALRFGTGKGIGGRSGCMNCGKKLGWRELIPIVSFFFQKGRCRECGSKISWQYPLVEFMTGAMFALIFLTFPPFDVVSSVMTVLHIIAACLLLVICVYDIKHKIIPDVFSYAFSGIALISLFVGGWSWWHVPSWWQIIAGPLAAVPFALIWLVSRGRWMGLGDAKLMLGIGWFLGISGAVNAIILAFWIAAAVSIIWMLVTYRRFKRGMEIPFGPYLIVGMYAVLLFGIQAIDTGMLMELFTWYN